MILFKKPVFLSFILVLLIISNCSEKKEESINFNLSGKWKEINSGNAYDKVKRENIFEIQKYENEYSGHLITLDNALDASREIRKCVRCQNEIGHSMILGIPLLKEFKWNGKMFVGKMFDSYTRKWYNASIEPIDDSKVRVRIFAYFSMIGKSFIWERGDKYFQDILAKPIIDIPQSTKGLYALMLGEISIKNKDEVKLKLPSPPKCEGSKKVYFFNFSGKVIAEGKVDTFSNEYLNIKILEKNENFLLEPSLAVVFYK